MSIKSVEQLREAYGRFSAHDLGGAERLCSEVLAQEPRNAGALHLLGILRLVAGNPRAAITLIDQALRHDPADPAMLENLGVAHLAALDYPRAETLFRKAMKLGAMGPTLHMRLGMALGPQGKLAEAERALRTAAERAPGDPDVHLNLGIALSALGRAEEALACFQRAVSLAPNYVNAQYNLGTLLRQMGRPVEALAAYDRVLALDPGNADAHNNLGTMHEQSGRIEEAIQCYRKALAHDPAHVSAYTNLGNALCTLGRLEEAAVCCEKALAIRADFTDALLNLGNVRARQGRFDEARALYEKTLTLEPRNVDPLRSLGALFLVQGRTADAMASYRQALAIDPRRADILNDLGAACRDGGDPAAAIAAFEKAVAADPRHTAAYYNLAETFKVLGRFDEAVAAYGQVLTIRPGDSQAVSGLIHVRQHMCDWAGIEALWEQQRAAIGTPGSAISPFGILSVPSTAAEQLACAKEWARQHFSQLIGARAQLGFGPSPPLRHARLRVGYLSRDFFQHATSYLIAELFELHDRERFEVFAYSYGPDDGSSIRRRIRDACEHFAEVSGESFVQTAQRIRDDGIDILIDLKGYTHGARSEILALRPAPVQVSWLGYPGSMGTDCVDCLVADPYVIPEGAERHYSERVVRLPDCYQINDRRREVDAATPGRGDNALPPEGFVFCCFNQPYKILPDMYSAWMRIMSAVPGSVLWLLETNGWSAANLRREAAARGIAAERLVFAPRKPMPEHLARYRLADLALDTFPYTSHTTASDALWMGCPLATCAGETFASRVAGSILRSAGLADLVTTSLAEYERLAVELATHRDRLQSVRSALQANRETCALFDTPRFVRNLEAAYQGMLEAAAGCAESPARG